MKHRVAITIKMYHPFEELLIVGVVDRMDQQLRKFRVDGEWFAMMDIDLFRLKSDTGGNEHFRFFDPYDKIFRALDLTARDAAEAMI